MSTPNLPKGPQPFQPMNLRDSTVALARLNEQLLQLTTKLEYLRLLVKLGVK